MLQIDRLWNNFCVEKPRHSILNSVEVWNYSTVLVHMEAVLGCAGYGNQLAADIMPGQVLVDAG